MKKHTQRFIKCTSLCFLLVMMSSLPLSSFAQATYWSLSAFVGLPFDQQITCGLSNNAATTPLSSTYLHIHPVSLSKNK